VPRRCGQTWHVLGRRGSSKSGPAGRAAGRPPTLQVWAATGQVRRRCAAIWMCLKCCNPSSIVRFQAQLEAEPSPPAPCISPKRRRTPSREPVAPGATDVHSKMTPQKVSFVPNFSRVPGCPRAGSHTTRRSIAGCSGNALKLPRPDELSIKSAFGQNGVQANFLCCTTSPLREVKMRTSQEMFAQPRIAANRRDGWEILSRDCLSMALPRGVYIYI